LQKDFFARLPAKLENLYGPTEAAVDVTYWSCLRESNSTVVPIGRPVANTQTYILDEQLNPVPVGVAGELHLGGVQIGLGYHNRPDLTKEKFIPDPFTPDPLRRLYKTGDLARYLPSGDIEYLGRLDYQVKLRGFRIELGEIESVLSQHPSVREAVVVAREVRSGDKQLVAYLVTTTPAPTHISLRDHLRKQLPEYMVPAVFVNLDELPLTSSGKVDRKALPEPEKEPREQTLYVAPRNETEAKLAEIWAYVLSVKQVSIHDNFFELGGHSLLALKAVSRIRQQLGIDLPLATIFEIPNVAQMAVKLSEIQVSSLGDDELAKLLQEIEGTPQTN
jgi:acyl-CoA synthetase (AMP-forming)/AMP-acid ligase II/acyl carrier protein